MARSDIYLTVLGIINEVQEKLSVNTTSNLTQTRLTTMLVRFMNDTIMECSDYGDWQEMYRETTVTAATSVGTYKITASAEIKNVYEMHNSLRGVSPLELRTTSDIRRLQKLGGTGVPHQFAMVGVSGSRPLFRVYNIPGTAQDGSTFDIAFYKKPRLYTTADADVVIPFPSRVIVQGTYAKALLEESGSAPTPQYQAEILEYQRMRKEALNRFTSDTGRDVYLTPLGHFSR